MPWIDQISNNREVEKQTLRARHWDTQVGLHLGETQTMLSFLTIEGVCLFLCLAAASLTLLLTIFSLYIIMYKSDIMAQTASRQEELTEQEPVPRCLLQH